jgi:hypothetical protein
MPIRSSVLAMSACLYAALLVSCADGGSSGTHPAGSVPIAPQGAVAGAQGSAGRSAHSGGRRTLSVHPTCSGVGTNAFVGGGLGNVAGGLDSFVGAGQSSQACDAYSGIASGFENTVANSATSYGNGFIGGGEYNVVTGNDTDSAVVAGESNEVSNAESAIVAGETNSVAAQYALVGGGESNTLSANGQYGVIAGGNQNTLSASTASSAPGTEQYRLGRRRVHRGRRLQHRFR